ncbi:hypothetical protein B7P43_G09497 [Cryptotermes secundus]|uniref:DDE Tnp4 domain-containing protein n=1 Tax=Cryptotermes secundus TaxID=105785 RepID=A0A2J7PXC0_9NEOP|nr:hypothetical protein B7P43_G09497 [Cryptotermes secundus]
MDENAFQILLSKVVRLIGKKDTVLREAISPHVRLIATLRFLATGRSFQDLTFSMRVSPQALGEIIIETCVAIRKALQNFIQLPKSEEEWKQVAHDFEEKWQFPHCLGAVDGKHIQIKNLRIPALVPSVFYDSLKKGELNIPLPEHLPGSNKTAPYVFVGDEAFELQDNFMKPYSFSVLNHERRIFNYRLSRGRRIVENFFGILVSRFTVFQKPINLSPTEVNAIVLACCTIS